MGQQVRNCLLALCGIEKRRPIGSTARPPNRIKRDLGQHVGIKAEYIWIDGTEPTPAPFEDEDPRRRHQSAIADPIWGFDGSSTNQATGDKSRLRAQARAEFPTRFAAATRPRDVRGMLVDGKAHPTNTRAAAARDRQEVQEAESFGIEQEYTMLKPDGPARLPGRRLSRPAGPVLLRRRRDASLVDRSSRPHGRLPRTPAWRSRASTPRSCPASGSSSRPASASLEVPMRLLGRPLAAPPHRRGLSAS